MKLTIQDRILIENILPKSGSFLNLKIIKSIRENLTFTEEEIKECKITEVFVPELNATNVKWDVSKDVEKEIFISALGLDFISDLLKKLDNEKKLPMEYYYLYDSLVNKVEIGEK